MIIHNINTMDGLTNGARGKVMEIIAKEDRVRFILIQFDNPNIGIEQRRKFRHLPSISRHPDLTPIDKFHFSYTLGDVRKNHAARATVIQFPLRLSWASTAHKVRFSTEYNNKQIVFTFRARGRPSISPTQSTLT